jgi:hypothetical protein
MSARASRLAFRVGSWERNGFAGRAPDGAAGRLAAGILAGADGLAGVTGAAGGGVVAAGRGPGAGQQAAAVHSAAPETRVMLDEMDPEPGRARGPEAGGSGAALPSEAVRGPAPAGGARLEAVRQVPALVAVAGPRQQRPGSVPTVPTHSHVGLRTPRCTRRIGPALRPRAP